MFPAIPGIQELLNSMRKEIPPHVLRSDLLAPSGVRNVYDVVGCNGNSRRRRFRSIQTHVQSKQPVRSTPNCGTDSKLPNVEIPAKIAHSKLQESKLTPSSVGQSELTKSNSVISEQSLAHLETSASTFTNKLLISRSMVSGDKNVKPKTRVGKNRNVSRDFHGCSNVADWKKCEAPCDGGLGTVNVELENKTLWELFHEEGNEMIVTRDGSPMFPLLNVRISGLTADQFYKIAVCFVFVDEYRYRFYPSLNIWNQFMSEWKHSKEKQEKLIWHPDSPQIGQYWCKEPLTFKELRLTNNRRTGKNLIFAPTMRKHRVQLVVTKLCCERGCGEHTRRVDLPLTEFIAVSCYYNSTISQLKIANNPSAKCSRGQRKRSREVLPDVQSKKTCEAVAYNRNGVQTVAQVTSTLPVTAMCTSIPTKVPRLPCEIPSTFSSFRGDTGTTTTFSAQHLVFATCESPFSSLDSQSETFGLGTWIDFHQNSLCQASNEGSETELDGLNLNCQSSQPFALLRSDEEIAEFIRMYLSPFASPDKTEDFGISIF